eukprot:365259-Heterocapsa_arctica.AAC.1
MNKWQESDIRKWLDENPTQGRCDEELRQTNAGGNRRHRQGHLIDAGDLEWARLRHPHWKPHRKREEMEAARHEHPQLPQ